MFDNFKDILQQATSMQQQINDLKQSFAKEMVTGESGAGLVTIELSGDNKAHKVAIDNSLLEDKEALEELVAAAINDAMQQFQDKKLEHMNDFARKHNIPTGMLPF